MAHKRNRIPFSLATEIKSERKCHLGHFQMHGARICLDARSTTTRKLAQKEEIKIVKIKMHGYLVHVVYIDRHKSEVLQNSICLTLINYTLFAD